MTRNKSQGDKKRVAISQLGLEITESALCKFLHKAGFTRQRLKTYAIQSDEALHTQFASDVSVQQGDAQDTFRKKGYSLRGTSKVTEAIRGEHISALCPMSTEGILACKVARGSVNGDTFLEFVENLLMPNLMSFNGYNLSAGRVA